ncbi:hypothetical protein EJ02DRAFT_460815 [Clathrospora elynae]|uniref:Uncharacterized protein n=1 Tax=Clathrospora elynae TaxID=706981 RepID=A0A6A5S5B0_9PLEO|nr:hypothetical protein EJ02DRAFT_460815 [Clathrospora elynae]
MTPARKSAKRQQTATRVFEQGVNPASPTPPSTVQRLQHSQDRTAQQDAHNCGIASPIFEPEASQLATNAQAADILREDNNEEELVEATADGGEESSGGVSEQAATAAGASLGVGAATAASTAWSMQQRSVTEELDALIGPHLHFRWRAC